VLQPGKRRTAEWSLPARQMVNRTELALSDAAEWLGDWHPLAEQLGSADGLVNLGSVSTLLGNGPISNLQSLRSFLAAYQSEILIPIELPAIHAAHSHASRHELRELLALDQSLHSAAVPQELAGASRRVGQFQLRKLRPLRDERLLQRYLAAVEEGRAHGWHTLVFGLTMALYSLPLRQGLLGYAQQSTRGFIYTAARSLHLSEARCREVYDELCAGLPDAVAALLGQNPLQAGSP